MRDVVESWSGRTFDWEAADVAVENVERPWGVVVRDDDVEDFCW